MFPEASLDAAPSPNDSIREHPGSEGQDDRQDGAGGLQRVCSGGLEGSCGRGGGLHRDGYDDSGHGSEGASGASASPASASTSKNSLSRRAVNPQMTEPRQIQASVG